MATFNLPINNVDAVVGLDLVFNEQGDLALDADSGDLNYVLGGSNISESLRRRLTTSLGGFARLVKTQAGVYDPLGTGYGSNLSSYISGPINALDYATGLEAEVQATLLQDDRITEAAVGITSIEDVNARISLQLAYSLEDDAVLSQYGVGEFKIGGRTLTAVANTYQFLLPFE